MIFFHRRVNNYKRSKLQYMNNNFKTSSVVVAPHSRVSLWPIAYNIGMWLIPNLISECTPNFNFPANYEANENDQDNENHPGNKNEGNYPAYKCMLKFNNRKKVLASLSLALNIFHTMF